MQPPDDTPDNTSQEALSIDEMRAIWQRLSKDPKQPTPPSWTQYDLRSNEERSSADKPAWMERQKNIADQLHLPDVEKLSQLLALPVPWLIGLGIASVVFVCACCGLAVFSNEAIASQRAAATQTAASIPTATPLPTATLAPPTPTSTPLEHLQQIASSAASANFTLSISETNGSVVINETFVGSSITALDCKQEIFNVQKAIWQQWASTGHPREVNVNIIGPLQDKYGNVTNGPYAHSTILSHSAPLFNWANLDADSAWNAYDEATIRGDL